jgi:hypothetical protein
MAATAAPAARPRGKFSVTSPGLKEYAIVFVGVLVVAGGVFWYERRKSAAAAATAQTAGSGGSTIYYPSPTGLSASQLLAWISDHQSSPAPAPAPAPAPPPAPAPSKAPGPVTDLKAAHKGTAEVISWRPPQFPSHAGTPTTYTIRILGKDKRAHNIGSRTSYNVGGLKKGKRYTAVVAPSDGPSASVSFAAP